MKKLILAAFIFFGTALLLSAQKSKVIGVFQLIENDKYDEAKGILEDAIKNKRTSKWSKTWYARGLLCHNAYKKGIEKKDENLYELYTDQLYVALFSYDRARYYDKRDRYDKILAPRYVLLANDLMTLGEKHFKEEDYKEAFRAFDYALRINKSVILTLNLDTSLLYNTTLSAYKSKNWDNAIKNLNELNEYNYSSNIPHLLFSIYMMQADTVTANKVLLDGIENYDDNEQLILLLVDLQFKKNDPEKALNTLTDAFRKDTSNYIYPFTMGLLHQKNEDYSKAIDAYKIALSVPSDTVKVYTSIGTCYYNMGAELDEKARTKSTNYEYLVIKEKSATAYESAIIWFEKAFALDTRNQEIIAKLYLLYNALNKKDKIEDLELLIQ